MRIKAAGSVWVRMTAPLMAEIDSRTIAGEGHGTARSAIVREMLIRYLYIAKCGRASLSARLEPSEIVLIAEACTESQILQGSNRSLFELWTIPYLAAGIEHAVKWPGLAKKHHVNLDALLSKLGTIDLLETFALADALERRWRAIGKGGSPKPEDFLAVLSAQIAADE